MAEQTRESLESSPLEERGLAIVRVAGEVSTKAAPTRRKFTDRLVSNLHDALGPGGSVDRRYDRLYLRAADPTALVDAARVFGVQSLARAHVVPAGSLEEVVEAGAERFAPAVAGRRFAVRARVIGDRRRRRMRARDVEVELGARLLPGSAGVDLSHPEVVAGIEIYQGHAYLIDEELPGPAGLPLGAESRAIALVSGGFDSAVAAWQLQRRGVALDYVFCNLGGAAHRHGTLRVTKVVADRWSYGTRPGLHAIDFSEVSAALQQACEPRYWQVILKRLMLRAAEHVARQTGASAIVTGESVGQVSSQTLQNLAVISEATPLPILRPLVGMNKDEIIAQARRIGTAELSAVVGEYCALVPRNPATHAKLDVVRHQESQLPKEPLESALRRREILDLRRIDADDSGLPELETREIPEGAVVIDLRHRDAYTSGHWPDALHLDFAQAMEAYPGFAREKTYVLYCEFGLKSAHLAERMQASGLKALHLRGGMPALRKLMEKLEKP